MTKLIRQRERVTDVSFALSYEWNDSDGGFGFPCDEHGVVDLSTFSPEARVNYDGCVSGSFDVRFVGVERYESRYTIPAAVRCSCGREVELDHFTNACDCGRDYNSHGDLLAPREQWGEETGEHLADILRIP